MGVRHQPKSVFGFSRNGRSPSPKYTLAALRPGSRRPHTIRTAFDADQAERLRALLHQSPRTFNQPTSLWTLAVAAKVSFEHVTVQARGAVGDYRGGSAAG
jgi:hypothetical protein